MAYQRTNWEDYPSTNTKVNAHNLNHQEDGIAENEQAINTLKTTVQTLTQTVGEMRDALQGEIDGGSQATGSVSDKVNKMLSENLLDGYLNMQERTPANTKILNGTLYGDDPYRFSVSAGKENHRSFNSIIPLEKGSNASACSCHGSVGGTATVSIKNLASAAAYLLVCTSYTIATGKLYASTIRLVTTGASGGSETNQKPTITNLAGGAAATFTPIEGNQLQITNPAATRMCQFSLIRLM